MHGVGERTDHDSSESDARAAMDAHLKSRFRHCQAAAALAGCTGPATFTSPPVDVQIPFPSGNHWRGPADFPNLATERATSFIDHAGVMAQRLSVALEGGGRTQLRAGTSLQRSVEFSTRSRLSHPSHRRRKRPASPPGSCPNIQTTPGTPIQQPSRLAAASGPTGCPTHSANGGLSVGGS